MGRQQPGKRRDQRAKRKLNARSGKAVAVKTANAGKPIDLVRLGKRQQRTIANFGNVLATLPTAYRTDLGGLLPGKVEEVLAKPEIQPLKGRVQLIFTSPPFPLNTKKKYDNLQGDEYLKWFASLAPLFTEFLAPTGSIVIEIGNAWEPGHPIMSTLALESLLAFKKAANLTLCQQIICHNPTRLPSPAEWVTVKRWRLKDSYTNIWWFSKTATPHANNRNVLQPYSKAMLQLLKSKRYNAGMRPSEHRIGEKSFLKNNGGSIAPSVLTFSNTRSADLYLQYCKGRGLPRHPARMPIELPKFFIKFLTKPGDLVLDPFGGSNTTGAAAEELKRCWLACEPLSDYIEGSKGRFPQLQITTAPRPAPGPVTPKDAQPPAALEAA